MEFYREGILGNVVVSFIYIDIIIELFLFLDFIVFFNLNLSFSC